jgi:hypothetical protein
LIPEPPLTKVTRKENITSGNYTMSEVMGSNLVQGLTTTTTATTTAIINWLAFKEDYLLKHYNRNTTKVRLCYAK